MLHWLYDPNRKLRRFAEENIKGRVVVTDPKVLEITEMANRNGMRQSDINSLAEELDPEKLIQPANDFERYGLLNYMMNLLLDDLNLDGAERDFLKEFAVKIGYPVEKAPFIIREIYNGLKNEESESEIKHSVEEILYH